MIVKDEFLGKLRRFFNLNLYEVKIWTALLSRGVSTAGELSDIANVPRSRSYDVLESLEKKGFVIMKLGKPIKYIAVPPKEVVERVKKNVEQSAREEIKKLSDGKNIYTETCLGALKKSGAIKETPDRTIVLHSMLFRAAILIHLYTHAQENQSYSDLIKKIKSLNNKTDSI